MKRFNLSVQSRTETGKGPNYRLRTEGRLPAVIYGIGNENEKVSLDYREFHRVMNSPGGETGLMDLDLNGKSSVAIVREIQRDPVTRRYLHVDLYSIRMDQENEFEVAIIGSGTPVGVREGGLLETHARSVTVRCLPKNIPNAINVDLVPLRLNQSVHVSDLTLPEGVTMVTPGEEVVYTIIAVRGAATATEEGAPGQPEVIGKKKEDEAKAAKK